MTDVNQSPQPPIARRRLHTATDHGVTIEDAYHWLRDSGYPKVADPLVLRYLQAENSYFEAMMAPHERRVEVLFQELKGRQQPDEASVPVLNGDWYYQWRYQQGGQYRIWSRWPASDADARDGPTRNAEVILDEPKLPRGEDYFRLGALAVSNGGGLLAYSTDTSGSERFRLMAKNLASGERLGAAIEDTIGSPACLLVALGIDE